MSSRLHILWLKSGPLHPLDAGGKIRTYNMLKALKARHEITFLGLCDSSVLEISKIAAHEYSHRQIWIPWNESPKRSVKFFYELARNFLFSRQPFVIEKYRSREMTDHIRSLDRSEDFDLIVCDFLTPAVNFLPNRKEMRTPILLFEHNVESLIWKRLCENAKTGLKRAYFKNQWRRMETFERTACQAVDGVAGVSEDDCDLLKQQFGLQNVLGPVPTGVDLSYFCPSSQARKPHSLVFLGSMDWMPNIDAVGYFAKEIFPAIKKQFHDATCTIVGRNPTQAVRDLAENRPGIIVTGTVADVRPYLAKAEAMIVPLRVGGGTRIKIYEGMATGIPVVSSTIGAEGLPVSHGENVLLADSSEAFATAISKLFQQPELRTKIGANGRALVEQHFGWDSATRVFEQFCFKTLARKRD